MTLNTNRSALRTALSRRRLLDLILDATIRALDAGDCPGCEVQGVAIDFYMRETGTEFRSRHIRVRPDYRRAPLDGTPQAPLDSARTE